MNLPINAFDYSNLTKPIFVLGPAYSGKSAFAIQLLDSQVPAAVIGTCSLEEKALLPRIEELKSMRPKIWQNFEGNHNLPELINEKSALYPQVLIDSLNQWIAAALLDGIKCYSPEQLEAHLLQEVKRVTDQIVANCQKVKFVLISSEVGAGISPPDSLARLFRQLTGIMNQKMAMAASTVISMTAGIPSLLKGK